MEVVFINQENSAQLGCKNYQGISQTAIPTFQENGHDVYLTRKFETDQRYKSWLIKSVEINDNSVAIYLQGFVSPDSVAVYATKQRRNFKSFIRKHNIVEVDFGHQMSLFCSTNGERKNTQRTDVWMPGEMHKKRPCIIIGAMANSVTIIPLTTKYRSNPKYVPITRASFKNLHKRYYQNPSFAVLNMIQTVSIHRVFPPREAMDGKYRHQYSRYRLSDSDGKAVDNALADIYNDDVTKKLGLTQQALRSAKQEKFRLIEKNHVLLNEVAQKDNAIDEMENVIRHLANEYGLTGDLDTIMSELMRI